MILASGGLGRRDLAQRRFAYGLRLVLNDAYRLTYEVLFCQPLMMIVCWSHGLRQTYCRAVFPCSLVSIAPFAASNG